MAERLRPFILIWQLFAASVSVCEPVETAGFNGRILPAI